MSSNNVVWVMSYENMWHVFYSGCVDNVPVMPSCDSLYYKKFEKELNAFLYAHDVVKKIDGECYRDGRAGVEYGVMEVPMAEKRKIYVKTEYSDELFENDFFKDEFDTRVEKHLKSYNRRLEALEKRDPFDVIVPKNFWEGILKEDSEGKIDCNKCDLYGECDHQGAYIRKDGRWCYEDSRGEKEVGDIERWNHSRKKPNHKGLPNSKPLELFDAIKEIKNIEYHYKWCAFLENFCKGGLGLQDGCKKECRNELIELIKKDSGSEKTDDLEVAVRVRRPSISGEKSTSSDSKLPDLEIKPFFYEKEKTEPERVIQAPSLTQDKINKILNQYRDIDEEIKELKRQIHEDLLACRGMHYKEMICYILDLENKYDEK